MATSSTRRWKGCRLCKMHKHKDCGQAIRMPWKELRKLGKKRKINRHAVYE